LVSVKDIQDFIFLIIEKVTAIEIAMNDPKVFNAVNLTLICLMEFDIRQHSVMNLIPILDSLSHFRMLLTKDPRDLMEFGKELAPGEDDFLIFHPLELNKAQKLSSCPLKNDDNQFFIDKNEIIL